MLRGMRSSTGPRQPCGLFVEPFGQRGVAPRTGKPRRFGRLLCRRRIYDSLYDGER